MTHDVPLTIPNLRAAIRGLTDTATIGPLDALRAFRGAGVLIAVHGLSDNEIATLNELLASYLHACAAESIDPEDGWLPKLGDSVRGETPAETYA